jgi:hypothetical protein
MGRTAAGVVMAAAVLVALPAMAQDTAKKADAAAANTAIGAAAATTQPAADEGAPAKRVTLTAGVDFASAYLFRGIFQEDSGLIMPPYFDVGVALYNGDGALKNITVNGGMWNSIHSGPSGSGNDSISRNAWYEADYYGSVTFTVGKLKPGLLYTSYTSPNDAFGTVDELAGVLAYDDSGSAFPLNPKAIVAFELKGQADGGGGFEDGGSKGTYFEFGVRPVVPLSAHPKYPVSLAIPAKLGMSLNDYYQGPTGSNTFGYFDLGGILSVPLAFMNHGSTWDLHGGLDVLWLGDNNKILNGDERVKPVFTIGVGVVY